MFAGAAVLVLFALLGVFGPVIAGLYLMSRLNRRRSDRVPG